MFLVLFFGHPVDLAIHREVIAPYVDTTPRPILASIKLPKKFIFIKEKPKNSKAARSHLIFMELA